MRYFRYFDKAMLIVILFVACLHTYYYIDNIDMGYMVLKHDISSYNFKEGDLISFTTKFGKLYYNDLFVFEAVNGVPEIGMIVPKAPSIMCNQDTSYVTSYTREGYFCLSGIKIISKIHLDFRIPYFRLISMLTLFLYLFRVARFIYRCVSYIAWEDGHSIF